VAPQHVLALQDAGVAALAGQLAALVQQFHVQNDTNLQLRDSVAALERELRALQVCQTETGRKIERLEAAPRKVLLAALSGTAAAYNSELWTTAGP
jgi:hypothetical protein